MPDSILPSMGMGTARGVVAGSLGWTRFLGSAPSTMLCMVPLFLRNAFGSPVPGRIAYPSGHLAWQRA